MGKDTCPVSRVTAIIGADITVITHGGRPGTYPVGALVVGRTQTIVITGGNIIGIDASSYRITAVISAYIAVIARLGRTDHTYPINTLVIFRTEITIFTQCGVIGIDASCCRIAAIVSTGVTVITIFRRSSTNPVSTLVILRTQIIIIT